MDENFQPVIALAEVLAAIGCRWLVVGSLASSVRGLPRSTIDADIVADLRPAHVKPLVKALGEEWYCDEAAIRDALTQRASFNLIHLVSGLKVGVFLPKLRRFDGGQFTRATSVSIGDGGRCEIPVCSAEDIVCAKLEWFRLGGETSERQWGDILGVLKANADKLDIALLRENADEIKVRDLLDKAMREARVE
jgi:hypothetical protein